jgi:hypothetical protein
MHAAAAPQLSNAVCMQKQYVEDVKNIMASQKTGYLTAFYPMFVQLPVFTGYYFALTMMCSHHLPSMVLDSAPFGFDLTISDPFHLAPFACSGTIMLAVRPFLPCFVVHAFASSIEVEAAMRCGAAPAPSTQPHIRQSHACMLCKCMSPCSMLRDAVPSRVVRRRVLGMLLCC